MSHELTNSVIPESVLRTLPFDAIWQMHPDTRGKVFAIYNDNCSANRYYAAYGKMPSRSNNSKTYMFSSTGEAPQKQIPFVFHSLVEHLNNRGGDCSPQYNQVVVNWYENDDDYTPYHKDCMTGMRTGSSVGIVSLVECPENPPR